MKCKSLMVQGTASHVGKSMLVAAFCRILRQDGYHVAPFKAQNMSLNSFITVEGGEMGRAQVVQAEAAGLTPHVDMNPVLIKPNTDVGAQVIIHGRVYQNMSAHLYHEFKKKAVTFVRQSFRRLSEKYDFIVIEGAGSPAEINLRENDIVNMGMAEIADCPVILAGDIDRGGVFASLVGTVELLTNDERQRIKGFIINKFRGDISLLKPGLDFLEEKTGVPVLGTIPCFKDIYIPEEDGVSLERLLPPGGNGKIEIAVVRLPRISNFTDFDPFEREPDIRLRYVNYDDKIGSADVVVIPGTKNTIDDLNYLHNSGYVQEILNHHRGGGSVVGICGGYQMLGEYIEDPCHIETSLGSMNGIGLLPIRTVIEKEKMTSQVSAKIHPSNPIFNNTDELKGYEIHMGRTELRNEKYMFEIIRREEKRTSAPDGFISSDGRVWGTYIHGIFDNDGFREDFVNRVMLTKGISASSKAHASFSFQEFKETQYDALAKVVRDNTDMGTFYRIAGLR